MAAPYTSVSISGYNANPPASDGTQTEANRVEWDTIKTKLPDPLKTAIEAMDANIITGFSKTIGGGGVTSTAISYQVLSTDQGKLVRATASGITITTPDATDVDDPFVFAFLNNSNGNVTFDGSGSQTVNGSASLTVEAGNGFIAYTDGTNWFTTGQTLVSTGAYTVADFTVTNNLAVTAGISGGTVSGNMVATQASMESAAATNLIVTPLRQAFHPLSPKAWCNFNGTGTPGVAVGAGVSSITDNGTGDYAVNWTTAFSTANYGTNANTSTASGGGTLLIALDRSGSSLTAPTTTAQAVQTFAYSGGALTDVARVYVAAFGDLA